jgi:hypothetical protein
MKSDIPAALALLRDWSIWLVSLQTGALGVASFVMGKGTNLHLNRFWLRLALAFFALSIFFATIVLASLPDLALRIPVTALTPKQFYAMPIFDQESWSPFSHTPVWLHTSAQHWLFVVGLVFVLAAILRGNKSSHNK